MHLLLALLLVAAAQGAELLNASYDPTRELFKELNALWSAGPGAGSTVKMSHDGSGKQARKVIDGLEADVVSLALELDIDEIAKAGLIPADWRGKQPGGASPWTSTIVFVVRKGNPKGIKDWADLAKEGVEPLLASPKTSGAARLAYLAAWAAAAKAHPGDQAAVEAWMKSWLQHVPTFDAGARGATTTFVRRRIGDVLLNWENEAWLAVAEAKGEVEIVVPPSSILAEPPVAVVEQVAARHGTADAARAYLAFLATPAAQELAAKHHYRPRDPAVLAKHQADFPALTLATVAEAFGGWDKAQAAHFADGASFDRLSAR